jgi:hypothetical protein
LFSLLLALFFIQSPHPPYFRLQEYECVSVRLSIICTFHISFLFLTITCIISCWNWRACSLTYYKYNLSRLQKKYWKYSMLLCMHRRHISKCFFFWRWEWTQSFEPLVFCVKRMGNFWEKCWGQLNFSSKGTLHFNPPSHHDDDIVLGSSILLITAAMDNLICC